MPRHLCQGESNSSERNTNTPKRCTKYREHEEKQRWRDRLPNAPPTTAWCAIIYSASMTSHTALGHNEISFKTYDDIVWQTPKNGTIVNFATQALYLDQPSAAPQDSTQLSCQGGFYALVSEETPIACNQYKLSKTGHKRTHYQPR